MKPVINWIKKHKVITGIAIVLVLVVGVRLRMAAKAAAEAGVTAPLKRGTIIEGVYGIGTVAATKSFTFRTGVASTIRRLYVKEGDPVKKGQRLLELDGTDPIQSPLDGTLTYLPVRMGETVFAQSTVLVVTDLSDRYITVNLEQRGIVRVKNGQKARVSFDSMREQSYEGVVESVYSNDANFLVRIGVKGLPQQVLPGMTADVAIGISEKKNVLLIPVSALDQGKVYLKGSRKPIEVKTGIVDGAEAEVVSGDLKEGDVLTVQKKAP